MSKVKSKNRSARPAAANDQATDASLLSYRQTMYKKIEAERKTKVIAYVTGDRRGMETRIAREVVDIFVEQLDSIGPTKKISLILYTTGGDTSTAWQLINLLHTFCDELEVIIIAKALSAGTLISLGANKIVMTKQAALGPIDPSLDTPLNPIIPGLQTQVRAPVSVEAVRGYLDAAKNELNITNGNDLAQILIHLADKVHPLVLGQIFRTHSQIRSLAKKLLPRQVSDPKKMEKIIDFLCAESGSHDYTINRREAIELGLNVEKPSTDFYELLRNLHKNYIEELELLTPYAPNDIIKNDQEAVYEIRRGLIESCSDCRAFTSKGTLFKHTMQQPGPMGIVNIESIQDNRRFEGWIKL